MCPRSASHRPRQDWRALRDVSPMQGWISDPCLPSSALHGSHCLSCDFTWSAKPCLEKQTSQLSLLMQQWTGSVWVWLLAGPIKSNWPNVRTWSVFQYPVTIDVSAACQYSDYKCRLQLLIIWTLLSLMQAHKLVWLYTQVCRADCKVAKFGSITNERL